MRTNAERYPLRFAARNGFRVHAGPLSLRARLVGADGPCAAAGYAGDVRALPAADRAANEALGAVSRGPSVTPELRALLADCRRLLDVAVFAWGYDAEIRPLARRETLAVKARDLVRRLDGELEAVVDELEAVADDELERGAV